jgi:hypothetical protein
MGLPPKSINGFPGKRFDAKRAGMITPKSRLPSVLLIESPSPASFSSRPEPVCSRCIMLAMHDSGKPPPRKWRVERQNTALIGCLRRELH